MVRLGGGGIEQKGNRTLDMDKCSDCKRGGGDYKGLNGN